MPSLARAPQAETVRKAAPWSDDWNTLVFVNGRFMSDLSTVHEPESITISNLSGALEGDGAVARQHLGALASIEDNGFASLNTAFIGDGALVHVPGGAQVDRPIHLAFVSTDDEDFAAHPRVLVVAGSESESIIIESYVGLGDNTYLTNAVAEIVVEEGAQVDHYRLLNESPAAFHVGTTRVHQAEDSTLRSASFALGTALARNDFAVLLDGPGAYCSLNGLYYTAQGQHIDNLISIDHAQPNCTSRLNYKGILDGNSRAVFGGEVMVRRNAQKSNAQQTDKNLLLSEDAEVDSKPSLMIYADDVQCGHGATAGQIDAQTLFYLRSRGLDIETASRMLVQAFAREIVDTVKPEILRDHLESLFDRSIVVKSLPVALQ
jgi:Fe-S cluster assembly protein SufD